MSNSLLLADDSPTIAKILGMALQSEAYEIRSVLTAEDALKELKAKPPYFFLVDLTLPGTNGYEFAKIIRADSKLKNVRVLLLASAFDPVDDKLFAACGADAVIAKPFDPSELRAKLRQIRDQPLKMPEGSNVKGSLSGQTVGGKTGTHPLAPATPEEPEPLEISQSPDDAELILSGNGDPTGDADSILSNLLGGNDSPALDLSPPGADLEFTNSTVLLDLSEQAPPAAPLAEAVLDLSGSFPAADSSTAVLDFGEMPPPAPSSPPPMASLPPAAPSAPAAADPLSANAKALEAFFAAEIDAKTPPAPPTAPSAPAPEADDSFDASLSSIDWGGPKEENLNAWSSSPRSAPSAPTAPKAPPRQEKEDSGFLLMDLEAPPLAPPMASAPSAAPRRPAPLAPQAATPRAESPANAPSGASSGGDFLFDTGGSNFRFSEDYIRRITKSFTGSPDEMILGRDPSSPQQASVFGQTSNDSAPPSALTRGPMSRESGGGAWSEEEVKRIEQIVREEVQMVVREVAEKVVWEVIPELAENIIRKELDKVLKEMDNET